MVKKTLTTLKSENDADINTNGTGAITGAILNARREDALDSGLNTFGLSEGQIPVMAATDGEGAPSSITETTSEVKVDKSSQFQPSLRVGSSLIFPAADIVGLTSPLTNRTFLPMGTMLGAGGSEDPTYPNLGAAGTLPATANQTDDTETLALTAGQTMSFVQSGGIGVDHIVEQFAIRTTTIGTVRLQIFVGTSDTGQPFVDQQYALTVGDNTLPFSSLPRIVVGTDYFIVYTAVTDVTIRGATISSVFVPYSVASGRTYEEARPSANQINATVSNISPDASGDVQAALDSLNQQITTLANANFNSARAFRRFNTDQVIDGTNLGAFENTNNLYTAQVEKITTVQLPTDAEILASGETYPIEMEFTHIAGATSLTTTNLLRFSIKDGDTSQIVVNAVSQAIVTILRDQVIVLSKSGSGQNWIGITTLHDRMATLLPGGIFQLQVDRTIQNINNIETELASVTVQAGFSYLVEQGGTRFGGVIGDRDVIGALVDGPSLAADSEDWALIKNAANSPITTSDVFFLRKWARSGIRFDADREIFVNESNVTIQTNVATGLPSDSTFITPFSGVPVDIAIGVIGTQFSDLVGGRLVIELEVAELGSSGFLPELLSLTLDYGNGHAFVFSLSGVDTSDVRTLEIAIPDADYSAALNVSPTATLRLDERGAQFVGQLRITGLTNTLKGPLHDPVVTIARDEANRVQEESRSEDSDLQTQVDNLKRVVAALDARSSHPSLNLPNATVSWLTNDLEITQESNTTFSPSNFNLNAGGGLQAFFVQDPAPPVASGGFQDTTAIGLAAAARRGQKLMYVPMLGHNDGDAILRASTDADVLQNLVERSGNNVSIRRFVPSEPGGSTNVIRYPLPALQVQHDWFTISGFTPDRRPEANELFFTSGLPTASTTLSLNTRYVANGNPGDEKVITLAGFGGSVDVSTSYTHDLTSEVLDVTVQWRAARRQLVVQLTERLSGQLALADLQVRPEWTETVVIPSTPATSELVAAGVYNMGQAMVVMVAPSVTRVNSNSANVVIVTPDVHVDTGYSFNDLFGNTDTGHLELSEPMIPVTVYDYSGDIANTVVATDVFNARTLPYFGLFTEVHTEATVAVVDTQMTTTNEAGDVVNPAQETVLVAPNGSRWRTVVSNTGVITTSEVV